MPHNNRFLNKATVNINDEFYTRLVDIENELKHYTNHFKDKVVYCNCDDETSNFYKYFMDNYDKLGIADIIISNGLDFRSAESIKLLQKCDIVVSNPPFSLFKEYFARLVAFDKKFLIIGNINSITYGNIFPLIKNKKIWLGISKRGMHFIVPSWYEPELKDFYKVENGKCYQKISTACWFTNLTNNRKNKHLKFHKTYNSDDYPNYFNCKGIDVSKAVNIPVDYYGIMGVPITYYEKINYAEFEIVGYQNNPIIKTKDGLKTIYKRLLIKRITNS